MSARPEPASAHAAAADPRLRIRLIDGLSLSVGGRPLEIRSARGRALLAALALSEDGALAREDAAALLWPDAGPDRARLSLRQTVKALNDALGEAGVEAFEAGRSVLALDRDRCALDLDALAVCAAEGVAHPALLTGRDPFAALCAGAQAGPAFAAWVEALAALRRVALARDLEGALAAADDPFAARDLATAALALDPASEAATRRLITAQAALGEPQKALEAYDALWRALDARAGVEPAPETQAAIAPLLRRSAPSAEATRPSPPRPLIAIRPFESERGTDRSALEAARLSLAAAVAAFGDWRVTLGDAAGADYVMRGAALSDTGGDTVLVTVESAAEDRLLSAHRAPLAAGGAGAAASAGALACAARRDLMAAARREAEGLADAALAPAARPLRLRALAESLRPAALRRARELAAAPGFSDAEARAAEARAAALAAALEGRPLAARDLAAALEAAERAVDDDPLSPEARGALGWCLHAERRFEAAAEEFALAAHLNPADAALQREAALGLALAGRAAEARGLAEAADALDPVGPEAAPFLRFMIACALGDPQAAHIPVGDDAPPAARAWRAAALCEAGERAAAAVAARALREAGGPGPEAVRRALPLRDPARAEALRRALEEAYAATADMGGAA